MLLIKPATDKLYLEHLFKGRVSSIIKINFFCIPELSRERVLVRKCVTILLALNKPSGELLAVKQGRGKKKIKRIA